MRFRRTLAALAVASAMGSSSCHWEYVGRSAGRQYNTFFKEQKKRMESEFADSMGALGSPVRKPEAPGRFSCDGGLVYPGGLKTESFVFLQIHQNSYTQKMSSLPAHSQILVYHVLRNLIKRFGIKTVILEGLEHNQLYLQSKEQLEEASETRGTFERCVSEAASWARNIKPGLQKKEEAEDVCLMNFFARGKLVAHWQLLSANDPGMRMIGFEIKDRMWIEVTETLDKIGKGLNELVENDSKKQQSPDSQNTQKDEIDTYGIKALLEGMREYNGIRKKSYIDVLFEIAPSISPEVARKRLYWRYNDSPELRKFIPLFEEMFLFWHKHGKYISKTRSVHALKSILLHSSHNTALVIGADHRDTMVMELGRIPHQYRPTVHFLEFECTNKDSFVTSNSRMLEILNALSEKH